MKKLSKKDAFKLKIMKVLLSNVHLIPAEVLAELTLILSDYD